MAGVYTIPAEDDFFRELAIALWQEVKAPEELSRYLLLLPTRHNARDLQEIFLELAGGNPVLPPCIIPLSEGEENDLRFYEEAELAIPPAIDRLSRQWQLAALIGAQRRHSGAPPLSLAVMLDLAYDLGGLLDQLEQQGATLGDIQKLVPEDLAEHWQRTVDFLNLLQTAWPEKLKAQNLLNPAERHNRLLRSQAASWAENPPSFPIIAAGAMGLEPAIADMLAVIAKLPTGRVVLPGLDQGMDQESWEAVGPLHPHYALKNLLQRLEIGRDKVKPWAGKKPASARAILWREVMRPAEVSDGWQRLKDKVEFTGLQLLECATPEEEAALIALLMREEREKNESATAALVTANRDLALRVIAQLKRWGIDVEDGAGQNFAATPLGQFLAGTSLLFAGEIEIADVLSVLKHPLCRMGRPKGAVAAIAQNMEKEVLRIKGAPKTLDLLLEDASLAEDQRRLLSQLLEWRGALAERYSLAAMVKRHLDFVTKLAATDQAPGGQILWLGSAGEAASEFFTKLPDERSLDQKIDAEDYAAVLPLLWQRLNLREPLSPNRLFVWGLAEARLKRARRMILGGLNENSWPDAPDSGPWLNRAMRKKTGLPDIDCKIGLAAHDFIMAAQGNEVFLTRSLREGGRPAAPSRWLQRLKAVAKAAGAEQELQQESGKYFSWLRQLDEAPLNPRPSPMPKPPLAARPKKLSVSEIELWMRDPYALYARKILNIKPLPMLGTEAGADTYGNLVHQVLQQVTQNNPGAPANIIHQELLKTGKEVFSRHLRQGGLASLWLPRFENSAAWLAEVLAKRESNLQEVLVEQRGEITLGGFTLTARADRIELKKNGKLAIIDIKTGALPSEPQIKAGFSPQLPLEALIALKGGFSKVGKKESDELIYWKPKPTEKGGEEKMAVKDKDLAPIIEESREGLEKLVAAFADPDQAYAAANAREARFSEKDYAHLVRRQEWGGYEEGEEEDE